MNNNVKFSVKNLNLYYGKFHALKGIDMDIPSNEVTAFIDHQVVESQHFSSHSTE